MLVSPFFLKGIHIFNFALGKSSLINSLLDCGGLARSVRLRLAIADE